MKLVYIDFNIFLSLEKGQLEEFFQKTKELGLQLVFSPAHVEEIFNNKLHKGKDNDFIQQKLEYLSKITDNFCLLPYILPNQEQTLIKNVGIFVYEENPKETYERVAKKGGKDNYQAESNQEENLKKSQQHAKDNELVPKIMHNKNPVDLLTEYEEELKNILNQWLNVFSQYEPALDPYLPKNTINEIHFNSLKRFFPIYEIFMEKSFNFLESKAFYQETVDQYINSLHDVTHAIYASYCVYFITNDKKLYNKSKAIYEWIDCPCKVVSYKEFIEN